MRLLLDTHIMLSLLKADAPKRYPEIAALIARTDVDGFVSVASIWETAIKTRLGKLDPWMPLGDIVGSPEAIGVRLLQIDIRHVIRTVDRALVSNRLALQL